MFKVHLLISLALLFLLSSQNFMCFADGDVTNAKNEICSLIDSGDFSASSALLNQLVTENPEHPNLPEAIFEIADRYRWSHKWSDANDIYNIITQNYSDSPYASRANLGKARLEVTSLIVAHDYVKSKQALNKMIADFPNHPDMPETLYWVGRGFGWNNRYEEEKELNQLIIQNHPDSAYATKAQLNLARAKIMSLINSQQYAHADEAIAELSTDFSEHPDFHDTLYWLAQRWSYSGEFSRAKDMLQTIMQNYPNSASAEKSQALFPIINQGLNVFSIIESDGASETAVDNLINDYSGHKFLPHTVFLCGEKYFMKALEDTNETILSEASEDFREAITIWEKVLNELSNSATDADAYYYSAKAYDRLGQYALSIANYARVVEDHPDYYMAWDAQFMIGHNYEKLIKAGLISKSEAQPLIMSVYRNLLEKYPDCKAASAAQKKLAASGIYITDNNDVN